MLSNYSKQWQNKPENSEMGGRKPKYINLEKLIYKYTDWLKQKEKKMKQNAITKKTKIQTRNMSGRTGRGRRKKKHEHNSREYCKLLNFYYY